MILAATPPSQGVSLAVFALRLLLRGQYCSLRHLHTATSPAKRRTTRLATGYASLNSRSCTRRIDVHLLTALLKTCLPLKAHSNPLLCMVWESPAPLSRSNPSLSAWSTRAASVGYVDVTSSRRQLTASYRSFEEPSGNRLSCTSSGSPSRWFPRRSGKTSTLRRILHTARRPEIDESLLACSCSCGMDAVCRSDRARLSRGCHLREPAPCLALQAAAPAEAFLSLLLRGLCSLTRDLSCHDLSCLLPCAAGQPALLVL